MGLKRIGNINGRDVFEEMPDNKWGCGSTIAAVVLGVIILVFVFSNKKDDEKTNTAVPQTETTNPLDYQLNDQETDNVIPQTKINVDGNSKVETTQPAPKSSVAPQDTEDVGWYELNTVEQHDTILEIDNHQLDINIDSSSSEVELSDKERRQANREARQEKRNAKKEERKRKK